MTIVVDTLRTLHVYITLVFMYVDVGTALNARPELFYASTHPRMHRPSLSVVASDGRNAATRMTSRAQSTVDFPIGGHVNVLSDYKETGPEKKSKF